MGAILWDVLWKLINNERGELGDKEEVKQVDANENRFDQLEEIARKNNAIEFPKEEEPEETQEETEETEELEEEIEEQEEEPEEEEEEDEEITIKVDGEERKVPLSKIKDAGIRTLQKETSADKRLQEATELLKQAKAEKQPDKPLPVDAEISDAELERIVAAIREGTDEEAVEATKKLYATKAQPDVSTIVHHELNMRDIKNRFESPAKSGGFADLMDNKVAKIAVVSLVNEKLQNGEPNVWETYEAAGKEVRAALGVKTSLVERKQKKKKIDNLEAVNQVEEPPKEKKPPTRGETIRDMAKNRVSGFI